MNVFVKDLRIFGGVPLSDILIVDNYIYSFAYHLENGIPVTSYYGNDSEDIELVKVVKYLISLITCNNMMEQNEKIFQLKRISESNISKFIKYYSELVETESEYSEEWSGGTMSPCSPAKTRLMKFRNLTIEEV
jgi:hypothetical protein